MVLITAAHVVIGANAQEVSSAEPNSTLTEEGYSLEADIPQKYLKPPDTSSPRATLLSFLENINGPIVS
jgi:hypothetical protein